MNGLERFTYKLKRGKKGGEGVERKREREEGACL